MHAKVAGQVYGVQTTGLRFFNVFGPRQDPSSPYSGVISIFADRLLKGQKITIHGDSQQVRDFVFVDDAVRHLVAAMDKASTKGGVYNVCGGLPTSVNNLAQVLSSICGAPLGMERAPDTRSTGGYPRLARRPGGGDRRAWHAGRGRTRRRTEAHGPSPYQGDSLSGPATAVISVVDLKNADARPAPIALRAILSRLTYVRSR